QTVPIRLLFGTARKPTSKSKYQVLKVACQWYLSLSLYTFRSLAVWICSYELSCKAACRRISYPLHCLSAFDAAQPDHRAFHLYQDALIPTTAPGWPGLVDRALPLHRSTSALDKAEPDSSEWLL